MTRSILIPILGLMGIVLYGTTRASRPPSLDGADRAGVSRSGYVEMEPSQPLQRVEPQQAPPPAPRLQSDVEAEEARAALLEATARRLREQAADSAAAASAQAAPAPLAPAPGEPPDYVPAPITPAP